jgi:predicted RNase H-like HicB family nuclease
MFNAIFEKHGEWWAAYIEEFPGVNTQGATLEEARENLAEAFQMVVETNRELSRRQAAADAVREPMALPA